MKIVLFLCAAFALSSAAEPAEGAAVAQEEHLDRPVEKHPEEVPKPEEEKEPLPAQRQGSCSPGWSKYGSRCFIYVQREATWVDAERYCLRYGANLASIHNPGEYDFIQEVVRGSTGRFPRAWLGGNDAVKDFAWLWSDGSGFYYQHWSFGEPDNGSNNEKCVVMNQSDDYLWGDANCQQRLSFVCGTRPV
uniref:C-type lectin domain-containing protein n=1 Tax=Lates calcarifer TaxID=8187 RepID=A0A4W6FC78_LATCA